ncbi:hypothetical protein CRG98_010251 [Punica granatum]|uniref:Uncharacterized protein n=1 Tax=Punica granatum TaxID=22663 RepID=A0A2I0KLN1_PUNGR|nr:hypothetical protein CRG98_010251 [Punica granatum]
MARGSQEGLSATSLGVRPRGSFGLPEPTRSPRLRFKLFPDMLAQYTMKTCIIRYPNRCSRVDWQTRLAVRLVGAVPIDQGGLFVRGRLHWIPKGLRITPAVVSGGEHMEKREKWRWCAVERLSARDHLVTGESEGHEEPLVNDGTIRHSREVVEMSGKLGKP